MPDSTVAWVEVCLAKQYQGPSSVSCVNNYPSITSLPSCSLSLPSCFC